MRGRNKCTGMIAKERLMLMFEHEPVNFEQDKMSQMKKEISEIIGRYFDVMPDDFEIRIMLKPSEKRA